MIKFIPFILLLLTACAPPKYNYYFDHYSSKHLAGKPSHRPSTPVGSPLDINAGEVTAGTTATPTSTTTPIVLSSESELNTRDNDGSAQRTAGFDENSAEKSVTILHIDRKQLKQVVKHIRRDIHSNAGTQRLNRPLTDQATQKLDKEVTVAIAFGAAGITLSLLGGISGAFWIAGVVLLGVGVYFFFDWLSKR